MKKTISMLLAVVIAATFLPVNTYAAKDPDQWLCGEEPGEIEPNWWFNPVGEPDGSYVKIHFTANISFSGIHAYLFCSSPDTGTDEAIMFLQLEENGKTVCETKLICNGDNWHDVDFGEIFDPGDYTLTFSCLSGSGIENNCWCIIGGCKGYGDVTVRANINILSYDNYPAIMLVGDEPSVEIESNDLILTIKGGSYGVLKKCGESLSGDIEIPPYVNFNGKSLPVTSIGEDAFYGRNSLTSVTIPDSVTAIGEDAFRDCSSLKSVTIPEGVTSIGDETFSGCSSLTSITIPDGVTSIGWDAFSGCSSLTNVTIPDSVTKIGEGAFSDCSGLKSVTIPDGVTFIGDEAFSSCSSLTSITIPDGVTEIGWRTFYGCSRLTSVTIPDGVTSIGSEAFSGCSGLKSITIPDSVTKIGWGAFSGCSDDLEMIMPKFFEGIVNDLNIYSNSDENKNGYEFYRYYKWELDLESGTLTISLLKEEYVELVGYTSSLYTYDSPWLVFNKYIRHVVFNDGIKYIPDYTLEKCSNMESIYIPDSIISIGGGNSFDNENLKFIHIPNTFEGRLDNDLNWKADIEKGEITISGNGSFNYYYYGYRECSPWDSFHSLISHITVENGVTELEGYNSFSFCETITLPTSIEKIHSNFFRNGKLKNIYYEGTKEQWESIDIESENEGLYYADIYCAADGKKIINNVTIDDLTFVKHNNNYCILLKCDEGASGNVVIPSEVKFFDDIIPLNEIGSNAFLDCKKISSVIIPDDVTSIGEYAFALCIELASVTMQEGVTSIGRAAFGSCSSLTSVTIPYGVTEIGDYAFSGCSGLESITVSDKNEVYHSNGNCLIETESKTLIAGCKNSVIPDDGSVTSIEDWAFSDCSGLTSVTIPDGVTSIGWDAFYGCSSLTSITIPDSVIYIDSRAFDGCSGLESITVSDKNEVYHSSGNCLIETESKILITGCKNSVIPDDGSVTSIGYYAFSDCSGLKSVTVPGSVTKIGYGTFDGCSGLESITVSDKNEVYHSSGNCLIETESKTLMLGCKNSVIPDDGSVTSIGDRAFNGCSDLTNITIPDGVTSIGYGAFFGCSSLTSVTIPYGVTEIGDYTFSGCSGLKRIYYRGSEEQWNEIYIAEYGNDGLKNAEIVFNYSGTEPGDINGDNETNNKDVVFLFRYVSGGEKTEDESVYDYNGDGEVNNKDVVALFRALSSAK